MIDSENLMTLTADIVAVHVSNNSVAVNDITTLIANVHGALSTLGDGVKAEEVYFLKSDDFQNHHGGMVKIGDHIYAGHQHGQGLPVCIEAATGEVKWVGVSRSMARAAS